MKPGVAIDDYSKIISSESPHIPGLATVIYVLAAAGGV
jgi:hypothetical protein